MPIENTNEMLLQQWTVDTNPCDASFQKVANNFVVGVEILSERRRLHQRSAHFIHFVSFIYALACVCCTIYCWKRLADRVFSSQLHVICKNMSVNGTLWCLDILFRFATSHIFSAIVHNIQFSLSLCFVCVCVCVCSFYSILHPQRRLSVLSKLDCSFIYTWSIMLRLEVNVDVDVVRWCVLLCATNPHFNFAIFIE